MITLRLQAVYMAALAIMLLSPATSNAYQHWSNDTNDVGQCAGCHGAFRSGTYTSQAEGISWGDHLHKVHLNNTDVETSCSNCHNGTGVTGNQVRINSSGAARDGVNAIGCMGCHGRLEDANEVNFFGDGWGAGLRQHHFNSDNAGAAAACGGCHADSNPASFTPAPEDTMPPWYASVTNDDVSLKMNPCNTSGEENFSANAIGLDNDGDHAYDTADSDCSPPVATPGDFDFDGNADILWRDLSTGRNVLHLMDGATIVGNEGIGTISDLDWDAVGTGDYDGDGNSDILWRNGSTGRNVIHLMDGSTIVGNVTVSTISNLDWRVAGNGDYNGDGKSDIYWRNSVTGRNVVHLMDGTTIIGNATISTVEDLDWQIVGGGDYNGDGRSDVFWRNSTTGENIIHFMNGATVLDDPTVGFISDLEWQVVGSGDYNGDGMSDVLWRSVVSGRNVIHLMDGSTIISNANIGTVGVQWQVVGDGDYNGDGMSDIVWRNSTTGRNVVHMMDGTTILSNATIGTVADPDWIIVNVD